MAFSVPSPILTGHIYNCKLSWVSVTQVSIGTGVLADDTGTILMRVTGTLTAAITSSGANGLDTGTEAPSTWYYVYAIYNPSTKTMASLLSTSASSPTMPSGYTYKRRVGAVRNTSGSNFAKFYEEQSGYDRVIRFDDWYNDFGGYVLSGGTAATATNVDCSSRAPSTATGLLLFYAFNRNASNTNLFLLYYPGAFADCYQYRPGVLSTRSVIHITPMMPCDSSQVIQYALNGAGTPGTFDLTLGVLGYRDKL